MLKISIVIPNYNGAQLLATNIPIVLQALTSYERETKQKGEIIIVDDGSSDTSLTVISSLKSKYEKENVSFQSVSLVHNTGFSSAVNAGVDKARGEIVVLLNTDVRPEKDFLFPLVQHFREDDVFAVGCMDKSIEADKVVLRGRGIGSWKRGLLQHAAGDIDYTKTLWASGGSSAFRKEYWHTLGGLDKKFNPFYWEDIDLSYRAWKAGFRVIFEKGSVVIHEHDKGSIKTHETEKSITKTAYRNQFLFAWKNMTDSPLVVAHLFWLPLHLLQALLSGNMNLIRGFCSAFFLLPKIFTDRRMVQKQRVRTDEFVIREVGNR